ncbi:MAG: hypothetical protein NVS2B17_25880 [Candidatus Velthaea sp.]
MQTFVRHGASRFSPFETDENGNIACMGFIWGIIRAVMVFFAVIVAVLVVVDGTLLGNLLKKKE